MDSSTKSLLTVSDLSGLVSSTYDTHNFATGKSSKSEPPLRDVMMNGTFASLRMRPSRMEVLPLPPVSRIAIADVGLDVVVVVDVDVDVDAEAEMGV